MENLQQWIVPGILFLVVVGFGFWVKKGGKPYNGLLFNVHKLIALGAVILTGLRIFKLDPLLGFPVPGLLLLVLAGLSVIAIFSTGGMMSIQDQVKKFPKLVHQVSAGIIAGAMVMTIWILSR